MKFPIAAYCLSLLAAMPTATTAKERLQQPRRILQGADASLSMAAIAGPDDWFGGGGWYVSYCMLYQSLYLEPRGLCTRSISCLRPGRLNLLLCVMICVTI